jgi:hypothetical protein
MGLGTGDRVRLKRDGSPEGQVVGAQFDGQVYVRLDNGSACTFDVADVEVLAPTLSKSWPPEDIETK